MHLPHDHRDDPHDDLVENEEKVHHQLPSFSHVTHNYTKRCAEHDQPCQQIQNKPSLASPRYTYYGKENKHSYERNLLIVTSSTFVCKIVT